MSSPINVAESTVLASRANWTDADVHALQAVLKSGIPMAMHMQVSLCHLDTDGLTLSAPLAPNANHMGTGFAGAQQAAVSLTGWGMTLLLAGAASQHNLVAQEAQVRFLLPVTDAFQIHCPTPSQRIIDEFRHTLARRGRARLNLTIQIRCNDVCCAEARARYVAVR